MDVDENKDIQPRVNSKRLANFVGKHVRLPCRLNQMAEDHINVIASDQGQVKVQLGSSAADSFHNNQSIDSYIEVIGRVINPTTVQMVTSINLGTELDMKLVNDTIELIHDPRYFGRMMS